MKKIQLILMLSFLLSCNQIETDSSLSKSDIEFIQSMHLLDSGEKVKKFYSEFKKQNAGNFYTDKRIAKYWVDERDASKNIAVFAYYKDIRSIDTVYNAGSTFTPYLLVTNMDSTQFKVSVNGKKEEVKAFFDDAIKQWHLRSKD